MRESGFAETAVRIDDDGEVKVWVPFDANKSVNKVVQRNYYEEYGVLRRVEGIPCVGQRIYVQRKQDFRLKF